MMDRDVHSLLQGAASLVGHGQLDEATVMLDAAARRPRSELTPRVVQRGKILRGRIKEARAVSPGNRLGLRYATAMLEPEALALLTRRAAGGPRLP